MPQAPAIVRTAAIGRRGVAGLCNRNGDCKDCTHFLHANTCTVPNAAAVRSFRATN